MNQNPDVNVSLSRVLDFYMEVSMVLTSAVKWPTDCNRKSNVFFFGVVLLLTMERKTLVLMSAV